MITRRLHIHRAFLRYATVFALMWLAAAFSATAHAQKDAPAKDVVPAAASTQPQTLDRVDAIVNNQVVLESDVEDEMSFAAFQPFSVPDGDNRKVAMQRLIDRDLLEQQLKSQPHPPVISDEELDKQLTELRRSLPACEKYDCASDKGWTNFDAAHGFTPAEIRERWRQRMVLLAFVEGRFRTGIRISDVEIESYYNTQFVPAFKQKAAAPPALAKVHDRIQEILLQQRVTTLLNEWLTSLREEGGLQILDPRDIPPAEAADASADIASPSPAAIPSTPLTPALDVPAAKKPDVQSAPDGTSVPAPAPAPLPPTVTPPEKK